MLIHTSRKTFLRQAGFALAGTCLPFTKLFAKGLAGKSSPTVLDTYHPADCPNSIDLATEYKYFFDQGEIAVLDGYYSKGNNATNPFSNDVLYDLEGQPPDMGMCDPVTSAGVECNPYDYDFNPGTHIGKNPFRYTAYYPRNDIHDYKNKPLPVYVFFHAGGFMECPDYTLPNIMDLCKNLSQKGFICFSVEYRRGRILDTDTTKNSVQQQFARYRAIQDGCGFIRSMIRKNRLPATNSARFPFLIDEDQVFVGGTSAGGIVAMGCAYYQTSADLTSSQTMIDATFPKKAGTTYEIKQALGNMHADYYYAPADAQFWPKFAGIASLWGGIVIPKMYDGASNETDKAVVEATFFQPNNATTNPPLIAFHGAKDVTVPFKDIPTAQDVDLSPPPSLPGLQNYNTEGTCATQPFSQKASSSSVELKICSSFNMYYIMQQLDRFCEFYTDCSMRHGLDADCNTCTYTSNFGTTAANQQETIKYLAERIAVFSQAIMYNAINFPNNPPLAFGAMGKSYFKDCENKRKCNGAEVYSCGSSNTLCNGNPIP